MRLLVSGLCLGCVALAGSGAVQRAAASGAGQAGALARVSSLASIDVTVSSPTHKPKVNVDWPVKVTVTSPKGKPLAATLTMQVLFDGQPVGKIDNGAVYHFVGTWQEKHGHEITWPAASRGEPLTLQFTIKAQGITVRKNWPVTVT